MLEPILFDEGFNLSTIVLGTSESLHNFVGNSKSRHVRLKLIDYSGSFQVVQPIFEETREVIHCHHVTLLV